VALVRTDVSEEHSTSFIRVTRIGELGTTLAVTSNRHMLLSSSKTSVLQEPHGVTSQKIPFFIVTAVKPQILHVARVLTFKLDVLMVETKLSNVALKMELNVRGKLVAF
jgi:hypothetical protein